jgi:hypothetical protein
MAVPGTSSAAFGVAFLVNQVTRMDFLQFYGTDNINLSMSVGINYTGSLIVTDTSGTVTISTGPTIRPGVWYFVELVVGTNWQFFQSGVQVASGTLSILPWRQGQSTAIMMNLGIITNPIAGTTNLGIYFDDFHYCGVNGSTQIGDGKVELVMPASLNGAAQWISEGSGNNLGNVGNINWIGSQPSGSVNNYSVTVGAQDSFAFQHIPTSAAPVGVQLSIRLGPYTANNYYSTVCCIGIEGGATWTSAAIHPPSSPTLSTFQLSTDPATGAGWTAAGVNGTFFGYRLVS